MYFSVEVFRKTTTKIKRLTIHKLMRQKSNYLLGFV